MKASFLNQFVSEMIDSWQQNSTWCTLQYEIINYVTMATYWVPDLPNVKGFSGFFCSPILIFFSDALFARSSTHTYVFKVDFLSCLNFSRQKSTKMLKTNGRTGNESVAKETKFIISLSVSPLELWDSVPSFHGFCRRLIEIAPFTLCIQC